jgi:hypothetical protein
MGSVLSAAGSALVAGSAVSAMQTQWIKVRRAFFFDKKVLPVGAVVELPAWVAAEAVHSQKAVRVEKPAPVVVEEPAAPAEVAPEPKGRKFNARK